MRKKYRLLCVLVLSSLLLTEVSYAEDTTKKEEFFHLMEEGKQLLKENREYPKKNPFGLMSVLLVLLSCSSAVALFISRGGK
ncbi:hypothetical protein [Vagococcus hydrophili]|uniref:Gram-positive cocci surface proteins LPxTG domain-containing protein n=1 Tax=Vagococcus hydrophili TaxID=2714947 RepID=A0A6G8ARU9_9ENTE|nr:hypothetical protein [Vagococcus hydrophili]QIL47726.1 hypothetical protein G7082_03820 [Vagococcus hydrophili]